MRCGIASALCAGLLLAGCRFYEPPKVVYTPKPESALRPLGPQGGPGAQPPAAQPEGLGSPTAPAAGGQPPTPPLGSPPAQPGPGGAEAPPAPQGNGTRFPPEDPEVLKDRLAAIAEAIGKYVSEHDGKLPESGPGGAFRTALLPYLSDAALWPQGTMAIPRAISGRKLEEIPERESLPLVTAGPRGTDGKQYAVFGDLSVREVPQREGAQQF